MRRSAELVQAELAEFVKLVRTINYEWVPESREAYYKDFVEPFEKSHTKVTDFLALCDQAIAVLREKERL
ncbi:MAG: hypothetical protein V1777_00300 [Candidatus Micrarchaeota archaeon]